MSSSPIELAVLITVGAVALHVVGMGADRLHKKAEQYFERTQSGPAAFIVSCGVFGATLALKFGIPALYFSCGAAWLFVIYKTSLEECANAEIVSATVKVRKLYSSNDVVLPAADFCARIVVAQEHLVWRRSLQGSDSVPVEELPNLIDGQISIDGALDTARLDTEYLLRQYQLVHSEMKYLAHQVRVCRPRWTDAGGWEIDTGENEFVTDILHAELGRETGPVLPWERPVIEVSGLGLNFEHNPKRLGFYVRLPQIRDRIQSNSCGK